MRQYSTDTIPEDNSFYKETGEAYYPYSYYMKGARDDIESATSTDWENTYKLNQYDNSEPPSERLIDMLLYQFNRIEHTVHAPLLISFMLQSVIRKTDYNSSTAPVEQKTLHLLREFIDPINKIEAINKSCDLINAEDVKNYLIDQSSIVGILKSGIEKIREIFGNDVKIELEVVTDPETVNKTVKLFAYIITSVSPEIVLKLLDRFDSEWYLKQKDEVLDLLNFNIRS